MSSTLEWDFQHVVTLFHLCLSKPRGMNREQELTDLNGQHLFSKPVNRVSVSDITLRQCQAHLTIDPD